MIAPEIINIQNLQELPFIHGILHAQRRVKHNFSEINGLQLKPKNASSQITQKLTETFNEDKYI